MFDEWVGWLKRILSSKHYTFVDCELIGRPLRSWVKGHLDLYDPVGLRLERLDLVVTLHTESERRCLAGSVRDQRAVQISVLTLDLTHNIQRGSYALHFKLCIILCVLLILTGKLNPLQDFVR